MSSSLDFVEYTMNQLEGIGSLRHRRMFGEFCVYVNEKPIVLICDDQVYLKIIPELAEIMSNAETGFPYEGASERYILDIDDRDLAREAVTILERATPLPKPKKKRS
ncbi:TfoX/Sxy family protein [Candidatus Saccharibacteria bacterium]|nr:TfoX/Sxy family protein [Candidatus Saccharibacteria bacterium]